MTSSTLCTFHCEYEMPAPVSVRACVRAFVLSCMRACGRVCARARVRARASLHENVHAHAYSFACVCLLYVCFMLVLCNFGQGVCYSLVNFLAYVPSIYGA